MTRRLRWAPVALLAVVLTACGSSNAVRPAAQTSSDTGTRLTVMTRNLYLGADLTPLMKGGDPLSVLGAVIASKPDQRMAAVADEIVAAKPDLVSLQEVSRWEVPSSNLVFDFQTLLLDALDQRGSPYHVVITQDNFDSAKLPGAEKLPARFLDRDTVLARGASGAAPTATGKGHFTDQLLFPGTVLGTVNFTRGYVWADIPVGTLTMRYVDVHLEAFPDAAGKDYTRPQVAQMVQEIGGTKGPLVITGDLNSGPGQKARQAYDALLADGFSDATGTGLTCCFDAALAGGTLGERIDHVLTRGTVHEVGTERVVGTEPVSATAPRWPSDHAGVVTTLQVG